MRTLVLGGARSGKSTHAEALAREWGGRVDYLATSFDDPADAEWQQRLALHRARRPASWRTVETTDVAGELRRDDDALLLVDCLSVWLTRMMDGHGVWEGRPGADQTLTASVGQLVTALEQTRREVVLVSNEVGLSVVPEHWSGRFFRDQLGILNMRAAAACERVVLCVAGIPVPVKGLP